MRQRLHLKLGHQLSMTPQLQQAIKLLQLSSLDLHQEIQQALYANPLLEVLDEVEEREVGDAEDLVEPHAAPVASDDEWQQDIPAELPVDARWDDIYPSMPGPTANSGDGDSRDFENYHTVTESLHDHLLWQLNLTQMSDADRTIAAAIIDIIGDDGLLESPIEDLCASLNEAADGEPLDLDEVVAVLHRIQQFDPPGVGAADLRDCLLIQLRQFAADTPHLADAKLLVDHYLPLVAQRNYAALCRKSSLDEDQIKAAILLIQTLSPRPGDLIASAGPDYITPDARVRKEGGRWVVALNRGITPRLCINQEYAKLVRRADDSADNTFLRNNLQEARWLLRSLESRNDTLLRVTRTIVDMQQDFLEQGLEAMKPLVLADVATRLDMHESTISRVTTQKYLDTPRGVFELKFFFSSHVNTVAGGECSSTAIRAMLKKMIASESPLKPLSDSKLAALLQARGIQVARRTVAKYRESLGIQPSSERRNYRHSA